MKKIAVVGSGISGLACAHYLQEAYEVHLFEKNDYLGGHTATKRVEVDEGVFNIDTGFIVFNDWTYPNFNRLLKELGVDYLNTDMGFSVSCDKSGLEYSGESVGTLFAQKRNLFKPKHWKMIFDILKFNRESKERLEAGSLDESITLGDYVKELGLSQTFIEKYLIPMGAAIWSSGLQDMYDFPALYFVRFFKNHGLLNVNDRPQWSVVKGGSKSYVDKLIESARFVIHYNSAVDSVHFDDSEVQLQVNGETHKFEHVILACHSDEALELLAKPTDAQSQVLGNLEYQNNEVVLHTDTSLLPRNKTTWSSWNYRLKEGDSDRATLSYSMNILQRLTCKTQFVVTLNDTQSIDPNQILGSYQYQHPVYNRGSLESQSKRDSINGVGNIWFCGAYWYAGFHEDGLRSALDVVNGLGVNIETL
ncbi:NAD(P)/FAD-dependent oxidoreductase [Pleionea sediminis]|uniref:NAD(P)/FAD-dependent oxidoreductase n=1 Tax=Pleionea sediminis TaxID=2569479 RepID=UPI001184F584|nr:FAD-dependent oxidoreductase [Pleionea sediminis]